MIKTTVSIESPATLAAHPIGHLPPSAKLVYKVLETSGKLTQKEIVKKTYLPSRTVRYALDRLRSENMIRESLCFRDARQSIYQLQNYG